MDRVFFTNSGTEANEGALKLARRWFFTQGDPERTDIVATWSSFHGRSMGAVAMTGTPGLNFSVSGLGVASVWMNINITLFDTASAYR